MVTSINWSTQDKPPVGGQGVCLLSRLGIPRRDILQAISYLLDYIWSPCNINTQLRDMVMICVQLIGQRFYLIILYYCDRYLNTK